MDDGSAQIELTAGARLLGVTEAAARLVGAKLCFGEPVRHGDRTVVLLRPYTRLAGSGSKACLGRTLPKTAGAQVAHSGLVRVGFIEIADGSARFRRIVTAADIIQVSAAMAALVCVGRGLRRRR